MLVEITRATANSKRVTIDEGDNYYITRGYANLKILYQRRGSMVSKSIGYAKDEDEALRKIEEHHKQLGGIK